MFSFFKRDPKKQKPRKIRLKPFKFTVDNRLTLPSVKDSKLELTIWATNLPTAEATAAELGFAWDTFLTGPEGY